MRDITPRLAILLYKLFLNFIYLVAPASMFVGLFVCLQSTLASKVWSTYRLPNELIFCIDVLMRWQCKIVTSSDTYHGADLMMEQEDAIGTVCIHLSYSFRNYSKKTAACRKPLWRHCRTLTLIENCSSISRKRTKSILTAPCLCSSSILWNGKQKSAM